MLPEVEFGLPVVVDGSAVVVGGSVEIGCEKHLVKIILRKKNLRYCMPSFKSFTSSKDKSTFRAKKAK